MMKIKYTIILFLFLLRAMNTLALNTNNITTLQLDRPVWALSLKDASWLFPEKETNATTFAIFSFSVEMQGVPNERQTQQEDDTGRVSRALPLYLGERINIETKSKAINYNTVLRGVGPVVSGKRTCGKDISSYLNKSTPTFIITGHFEKKYLKLQNKLSIYIYDTNHNKESLLLETSSFFSDEHHVASLTAESFLQKLYKLGYCKKSSKTTNYPPPPNSLLSAYLDALGQLFMQTLAQNSYVSKDSLWGEENMLNWYLRLWNEMPQSNVPKIMYLRGVTASINYKGNAYKKHTQKLENYFKNPKNHDDVLNLLSPIYYQAIGNETDLKAKCKDLTDFKDPKYKKWLKQFETK